MANEIQIFIYSWVAAIISLCYCYTIRNTVPKGTKRLLLLLPVICLFLYLPLNLNSPHLDGPTAFFLAWLANFKLLLLAFDKGPLSSDPSISLPIFVAISCLPIKIQRHPKSPPPKSHLNKEGPLNYTVKALLVAMLVRVYDYIDFIHPSVVLILYSFHTYFLLEIILAIGATLARTLLGLEQEPQFNEPYLATSLQDFWGKRWNLMATSILRPTVYEPLLGLAARAIRREWAPLPAVFGTFVVSALMHELMFYYLGGPGRVGPTWEVTWFFLLHGLCLCVEIALKKGLKGKGWSVPRVASRILTVAFVMATGFWLFFPKFVELRIDVKAFEDYAAMRAWARDVGKSVVRVLTAN